MTPTPHYHKANGKAKSAVKISKSLFKKVFRDGKNPWLALLEHRNTPVETIGSIPALRLMPRRRKTLMPTASTLLRPRVVEGVKKQKQGEKTENEELPGSVSAPFTTTRSWSRSSSSATTKRKELASRNSPQTTV